MPVPSQESDWSCLCILSLSDLSLYLRFCDWMLLNYSDSVVFWNCSDIVVFWNCSDIVVFSCLSCYYKPKVEYQLVKVWNMVFTAIFTNILTISWRSVSFVEETGETHRSLSHNVVSSTPLHEQGSNSQR